MAKIILKNKTATGDDLVATFLPESGMNLISYKRNNIEVIDQSTRHLFEERFAGLGALIGPHFHRRKSETIPQLKDESLFPHIARVRATGPQDPFSHGIGRYAPWQATFTETKVNAVLTGKDTWNGVPLSAIEGQNFKMTFNVELTTTGLLLDLAVVSDTASLVGIHYYYHLPQKTGTVTSRIKKHFMENGTLQDLPDHFPVDAQQMARIPLNRSIDWTFYPFPNPLETQILLDAETHKILTTYWCASQENSWQLYHPENASFACVEPLSSQDPRHPNLSVSSIRIHIELLRSEEKMHVV